MRTPICKYYSYGNGTRHSGFVGKGCHLLMGCEWETKDGYPSAIKQSRHCKDYEPKTITITITNKK